MDADTGKVLQSWGAGAFAMPHMLSFDWEGNMWLTGGGVLRVGRRCVWEGWLRESMLVDAGWHACLCYACMLLWEGSMWLTNGRAGAQHEACINAPLDCRLQATCTRR